MNQPGWYHDPGGAPGQYRYWDGSQWSPETTTSPPGSPGARNRSGSGRSGLILGVVAIVALLLVAVVWRANTAGGDAAQRGAPKVDVATPTVSAWDETSSPSSTPEDTPTTSAAPVPTTAPASSDQPNSTEPSSVEPTDKPYCPPTGGEGGQVVGARMESGNLSVPLIPSWDEPAGFYLPGISNAIAQNKLITSRWESTVAVGSAPRKDYASPQEAAQVLTKCLVSSSYYKGMTRVETSTFEAITIDGRPGHRIATEVYVSDHGPNIPGDVVNVIVVDTGDPTTYGVLVTSVTIGDTVSQAEVDPVLTDIRVVA